MKRFTAATTAALVTAAAALAQDSVVPIPAPGATDAIIPWGGTVRHRYVVDLVPLTSSWGNAYQIGPVAKAHSDDDILFPSLILGSAAVSPDALGATAFASTAYSVWNAPGEGVNTAVNAPTATVGVTAFDWQFGLGFSDFSISTSFAAGAIIGRKSAEPARLFVDRVVAGAGRADNASVNTSTVSLGGVDASGNLAVRVDDFNSSGSTKVNGENIVSVSLPTRSTSLNRFFLLAGVNRGSDNPASVFEVNASTVTTNTPASLPASVAGSAFPLVLDFSNDYRPNGGAGINTHLAAGVDAHRGNPSFSLVNALGGVGTMASLARASSLPTAKTDTLNLTAINAVGTPVATRAATLPVAITDGAGFTANTSGDAEFLQYLSQVCFRGGNGQVGVGLDPATGDTLAAATATDPAMGEFVAVARFPGGGGGSSWTVAAFEGKPVLDGPAGATLGTIVDAAPLSISAPAIDRLGNVYFVAAYQPTGGLVGRALIKAVNTGAGYRLEALVKSGDSFLGANSTRSYTIDTLTLEDSDSIASGAFHSAHLLQPQEPGAVVTGASDPFSFGGAIVNATITYDNAGTPESYNAVLFIGPRAPGIVFCPGNADGNNIVDFDDITAILSNWLNNYAPPPDPATGPGDADASGVVDFDDITSVLSNWLDVCP
ncbi:MAG TPA: hypothetical protein DEB06_00935 [Phycisphaerales bacterium]|nr:hypothetical protein [Phycisphaerales bacterium]